MGFNVIVCVSLCGALNSAYWPVHALVLFLLRPAGLFTPYDSMEEELKAASKATGEKLWRMPMEESYFEGLKSACADMVNTGPRDGGSITASLFLKQVRPTCGIVLFAVLDSVLYQEQ